MANEEHSENPNLDSSTDSTTGEISIGTKILYQWGRDKDDWYEAEVVSKKKTAGWWVVQWACDGQKHQLLLNESTQARWCVIQQPGRLNTRSTYASLDHHSPNRLRVFPAFLLCMPLHVVIF
jgi:hypothetical protein